MPAASAASTTSRASFCVAVERVPRAEADDRPEAPLLHQASIPRATTSGGERGAEEGGILLGPAAHVTKRQTRARVLPAVRRDLIGPGDDDLAEAQVEDRLRVMRDAAVAFARVGLGRADGEHRPASERRRDVGGVREREGAVPELRARADDPGADARRRPRRSPPAAARRTRRPS